MRSVAEAERTELSYSQAVSRLEEILERLERGEVDIDELSAMVQEAAELVSLCRRKLTQAEMQVRRITERLERESEQPEPSAGVGEEEEVPF
ncbi:exodeoxyribonuclease VII small subunit [Candidatus Bipolaricaulota sp. J31]